MGAWEFFQQNQFIVGALTGSLAAFLLGLGIEYYQREKKSLGYSIASRKIVDRGDKNLEIKYKDHLIDNFYSHQVTVRNIGNRALKDIPIRISCDRGIIVESELSTPVGSDYKKENIDNDRTILVNCDLINRGEAFLVGLTTMNTNSESISVAARSENLTLKEISQAAKLKEIIEILADQSFLMQIIRLTMFRL